MKQLHILGFLLLFGLLCYSCAKNNNENSSKNLQLTDTKWWKEWRDDPAYYEWIHFNSDDEFTLYKGDKNGVIIPNTGAPRGNYSILDDGKILFMDAPERFSYATVNGSKLEVTTKDGHIREYTKK